MAEAKKLKKPVEVLRKELLADKRTQGMATKLGMTPEAYVEKVLYWAQHPDEEPVLNVAPEAEIKAAGGATVEDVKAWMKAAAEGKIPVPGAPGKPQDTFEEVPGKKKKTAAKK